jgi:hypothetical protein
MKKQENSLKTIEASHVFGGHPIQIIRTELKEAMPNSI